MPSAADVATESRMLPDTAAGQRTESAGQYCRPESRQAARPLQSVANILQYVWPQGFLIISRLISPGKFRKPLGLGRLTAGGRAGNRTEPLSPA